jgi:hypothetical protein
MQYDTHLEIWCNGIERFLNLTVLYGINYCDRSSEGDIGILVLATISSSKDVSGSPYTRLRKSI